MELNLANLQDKKWIFFLLIKEKNTKHLIIDVQNNIGGEEGNENLLASYLFKEAFQKYESVIIPIAAYDNFKKSKSPGA